jgi:hypothetical protein
LLVVVYSVLVLALLGSGALLYRALRRAGRPRLFTSFAAGLSALHLLLLAGLPLGLVLGALLVMAAVEGVLQWRARRAGAGLVAGDARWLALIFASALPLWAYTMFRPLWAFDARNQWLFSGRMMFVDGRLQLEAFHRLICHWGPDYRLNMNADYPKLVGSLGAAVATLLGYWNEYLPKTSVLILHTFWLLGLFELGWRGRAVAVNLLLTLVSRYRYFFDSASLDLHTGMLTLISILALVRSSDAESPDEARLPFVDMAVAALAVSSQLKYEGRALAVVVLGGALLARASSLRDLKRAAPAFVLFLPAVVWLVEVRLFHIPSYLQYSHGLAAARERFHTELFGTILPGIGAEPLTVTGLVALAMSFGAAKLIAPTLSLGDLLRTPGARLGVLTALGYSAALIGVYLVSPYTTAYEQMSSSIGRTTFVIQVSLFAAALAIIERARRAARPAHAPVTP